jgi:hypothetical protein
MRAVTKKNGTITCNKKQLKVREIDQRGGYLNETTDFTDRLSVIAKAATSWKKSGRIRFRRMRHIQCRVIANG